MSPEGAILRLLQRDSNYKVTKRHKETKLKEYITIYMLNSSRLTIVLKLLSDSLFLFTSVIKKLS